MPVYLNNQNVDISGVGDAYWGNNNVYHKVGWHTIWQGSAEVFPIRGQTLTFNLPAELLISSDIPQFRVYLESAIPEGPGYPWRVINDIKIDGTAVSTIPAVVTLSPTQGSAVLRYSTISILSDFMNLAPSDPNPSGTYSTNFQLNGSFNTSTTQWTWSGYVTATNSCNNDTATTMPHLKITKIQYYK